MMNMTHNDIIHVVVQIKIEEAAKYDKDKITSASFIISPKAA